MPRQPNDVLRQAMKESGLKVDDLAKAVNDAFEQLTGSPGTCSARQVHRWLSGEFTWPKPRSLHALERVFGMPASELGFRPPANRRQGVTVRVSTPTPNQDQPVHRRKFVISFGSLVALPALPEAGRLGMTDIARVRSAEASLTRHDAQHGGAQLVEIAERYVEHVEHSMRHCTYGSKAQVALHQALGELCATVGWLSYDSDQHTRARHWWDTGLRYALLARDSMLQAHIWSQMSRQAVDLGHGSEAVAIARAALDATRNRRDPRLGALLHSRVALGHSVTGASGRCGQSLHRAEVEIDRASDTPSLWMAFCGPAEIAGQAALCFYNLNDYTRAAQADRDSLAVMKQEEFQRNVFATRVSLARNCLAAGEAEEALAAAHEALVLLPQVRSLRWVAHLEQFGKDLVNISPKVAAEFADRYRRAIHG